MGGLSGVAEGWLFLVHGIVSPGLTLRKAADRKAAIPGSVKLWGGLVQIIFTVAPWTWTYRSSDLLGVYITCPLQTDAWRLCPCPAELPAGCSMHAFAATRPPSCLVPSCFGTGNGGLEKAPFLLPWETTALWKTILSVFRRIAHLFTSQSWAHLPAAVPPVCLLLPVITVSSSGCMTVSPQVIPFPGPHFKS